MDHYTNLKDFCVKCGAEFDGDTAFCTTCGAKREAPPAAPAYHPPVAPVYYAPAAPAKPVHKHKFPAAPLVFVIMAMLYTLISAFAMFTYRHSPTSLIVSLCIYTMMIVGLAVHRGRISPLFGIAVILLALCRMYWPLMNVIEISQYRYFREDMMAIQLLNLIPGFFMLIAGISYLVPANAMRVLKVIFTIFSIVLEFLGMIVTATQYHLAGGTFILGYLFITLPELLALLSYSPSKEP